MNKKLIVGSLIGLGLIMVLLFGLRLTRAIRHWSGPPRPQPRATTTDVELIRDWMTIPYIAHTYDIPDHLLFKALDIPGWENRKKSLAEINEEYFPGQVGFVIARLQEAIEALQDHAPQPPLPDSPSDAPPSPMP